MPLYRYRETGERVSTSGAHFPVEYRRAAQGGVAEEPRHVERGIFKVIKQKR